MVHYQEYLLLDKEVERKVLTMVFTENKIVTPENLYMTGYEYISFKKDSDFALETVLASVVPMDKNMVILNSGKDAVRAVEICLRHDIKYKTVDVINGAIDLNALEEVLGSSECFSHICLPVFDELTDREKAMAALRKLTEKYNAEIILYCPGDVCNINHFRKYSVDYMIGNIQSSDSSFVLARRNKLVQIEGNSRSIFLDLYGFWQQKLRNRRREIEPMFF